MFESIRSYWGSLDRRSRIGVSAGAIVILLLVVAAAVWALRDDPQVLFSDLGQQDAGAIVSELERMKVPYELADNGSKILVAGHDVYKTRLKLMGKGVPLQGGVGFEVFDKSDFGMTEFAQKVNFQRALQGELARTIMGFDEVKFARVHLVMPETSIFKQNKTPTKASVTLVVKDGRRLSGEQVLGIQRLVAAAVPNLDASMVTVLDQRGVTLTRATDVDSQQSAASGRLELKRDIEAHLTRKVLQVIEGAFGPGQGMVSVDVSLNLDQIRRTQEDVIPLATIGREVTGAVSRKKLTVQSQNPRTLPTAADADGAYPAVGVNSATETEYQLGRRVEQIVTAPGSIRRLSVGVLVPKPLDEARAAKLRDVIAMSVGFNAGRGDAIAVHSVEEFVQGQVPAAAAAVTGPAPAGPTPEATASSQRTWMLYAPLALLLAVVLLVAAHVASRKRPAGDANAKTLSEAEREALLSQLREWLGAKDAAVKGEP